MHGNIGTTVAGEQTAFVRSCQETNAERYVAMEDPVCDALNLASALDKVLWHHKEQGEFAEDVWRELDAIVRTLRANLGIAASSYSLAT